MWPQNLEVNFKQIFKYLYMDFSEYWDIFSVCLFHCQQDNSLKTEHNLIINITISHTHPQPLIMALEDSFIGNYQSHQTPSSGRKSERSKSVQ